MKLTNPKTKEKVTIKEFFHQWGEGMKKVTPLQQAQTTQWGQTVSAIGVIWGIIFSIRIGYWWMAVILFGGMIVLAVQYLGNWQKKVILKAMETAWKSAEEIPLDNLPELNLEEVKNGTTRMD